MKLYGALASPYVARVVLFARLKGIALEPQMPPGGIKSPEYLAKNPMGKMPVLELDGLAFPESEVICELLEDLHPGTGGLPGNPVDRAHARLVSRVHDVYVGPSGTLLIRNFNPANRDEHAVAGAKRSLETGLGYLEHFVKAAPFAAGSTLTLADCALLPQFYMLRRLLVPTFGIADPTAGSGKLARWWSAAQADATAGAFLEQYATAVDGFLKILASR